jgi:predicted CXXCH cytochrome family protein
MSIPKDMPLVEGRLNCVTCHYAHPKENIQLFVKKHNYLRRNVEGVFFCLECHTVDNKGHIVLEKVHTGSYKVTDNTTRIDPVSLECIVCHDSHMKADVSSLGAGTWKHFSRKFNHTIGASYKKIGMKNIKKFRPMGSMSKEIRLYDGKVGCGTCHNIYSKEKNMLVVKNSGSQLCLECHNK